MAESLDDTEGLRRVFYNWREGRRYGYPICCIAHFCWDGLIGWPSGVVRWHQIDYTRCSRCVPCGLLHPADSPYPVWSRVWRILEFNWRHLLPTRTARTRRVMARCGSTVWRSASIEFLFWAQRHGELERLYWDDGGLNPELDWPDI